MRGEAWGWVLCGGEAGAFRPGIKRVSVTLVRKEMKKRKIIKLILTCMPTNAGNGGSGTCEA